MRYVTKSGDMWDSIAFEQLGSESFTGDLISNNLEYKNIVVFDSGIELSLPDIVEFPQQGIDYSLPPWR